MCVRALPASRHQINRGHRERLHRLCCCKIDIHPYAIRDIMWKAFRKWVCTRRLLPLDKWIRMGSLEYVKSEESLIMWFSLALASLVCNTDTHTWPMAADSIRILKWHQKQAYSKTLPGTGSMFQWARDSRELLFQKSASFVTRRQRSIILSSAIIRWIDEDTNDHHTQLSLHSACRSDSHRNAMEWKVFVCDCNNYRNNFELSTVIVSNFNVSLSSCWVLRSHATKMYRTISTNQRSLWTTMGMSEKKWNNLFSWQVYNVDSRLFVAT